MSLIYDLVQGEISICFGGNFSNKNYGFFLGQNIRNINFSLPGNLPDVIKKAVTASFFTSKITGYVFNAQKNIYFDL